MLVSLQVGAYDYYADQDRLFNMIIACACVDTCARVCAFNVRSAVYACVRRVFFVYACVRRVFCVYVCSG